MPHTFEIYFHNLTPQAQKDYLEFQGVSSPGELNCDILPIAIIEKEPDND